MKKAFDKFYDKLLTVLEKVFSKIKDVFDWSKETEEELKEKAKDYFDFMKTGEFDEIKYGVGEEAEYRRNKRKYGLDKKFFELKLQVWKSRDQLYKEFILKHKNIHKIKDKFASVRAFGKNYDYKYNETHWIPIPKNENIKRFFNLKFGNKIVSRKDEIIILRKIHSGAFDYENFIQAMTAGIAITLGFIDTETQIHYEGIYNYREYNPEEELDRVFIKNPILLQKGVNTNPKEKEQEVDERLVKYNNVGLNEPDELKEGSKQKKQKGNKNERKR